MSVCLCISVSAAIHLPMTHEIKVDLFMNTLYIKCTPNVNQSKNEFAVIVIFFVKVLYLIQKESAYQML